MKSLASGLAFSAVCTTASAAFGQQWGQPAQPATPGQYPTQTNPSQNNPNQQAPAQQSPYATPPGGAEQQLAEADRRDTGRGLEWVWLNGEIGFEALGVQGLKDNGLVDGVLVEDSAAGLSYGAGVGVRVIVFTVGARFRYGNFSAWDLWSLNLEGGFHIPIGRLEPYFVLGAGYSSLGAIKQDAITTNVSKDDIDIDGYNIRIGGGLDYYVTPRFSVGAALNGDLLGLYRSAVSGITVPPGSGVAAQADATYSQSGSGLGWAFSASAVVGLHF